MILYPAIDLLGGEAVQLVGGKTDSVRVRVTDIAGLVKGFARDGFSALHVVDLNGALGSSENRAALRTIIRESVLPVQVGGGLRTTEAVDSLFDAGAARVLIGTRALIDGRWLSVIARRHPGRVVVAADTDGAHLLVRGWTATIPMSLEELFEATAPLPLAGFLVTDVPREGRLGGVRPDFYADLVRRAPHPIVAAGGITTVADLHALRTAGAEGCVLGMSLYTGRLTATDLKEFL